MELREGLLYSKSHEWVKEEGEEVLIGLTDYAQSELGDLVFVNLPEEGDEVTTGESFADVESVKAVSDVYSPVTGVVSASNVTLNGEAQDVTLTETGATQEVPQMGTVTLSE